MIHHDIPDKVVEAVDLVVEGPRKAEDSSALPGGAGRCWLPPHHRAGEVACADMTDDNSGKPGQPVGGSSRERRIKCGGAGGAGMAPGGQAAW